jgi:hypothetical protein
MQQEGSDAENARLRRLVAELLYLVSVQVSADDGLINRQDVLILLEGKLEKLFRKDEVPDDVIYRMLREYVHPAVEHRTANFVTQLLATLNTRDAAKGQFSQRNQLARLIFDLMAPMPSMEASAGQEDLSDLTCHHDGFTWASNARRLADAKTDLNAMNISAASMPPAAATGDNSNDDFAGGLALSEGTPQDTPPTEVAEIVTNFRAGNYIDLQDEVRAEAVIEALSSSFAVMRSLLAEHVPRDPRSYLEADEGGENEEGKAEEKNDDIE